MLSFESDYVEGAHERILQCLAETNMEKLTGYGQDPYCVPPTKKKISASGHSQALRIFSF